MTKQEAEQIVFNRFGDEVFIEFPEEGIDEDDLEALLSMFADEEEIDEKELN